MTAYSRRSFEQHSFQQDELAEAHSQSPTRARQLHSLQQMELSKIESFIHQLDLENSLSLPWFSLLICRYQLQPDSFDRSSFEQRALPCAALLYKPRINIQLQERQVQSFQLTVFQLSFVLVSGRAQHRAFQQPALTTRACRTSWHSTALTLMSLSLAINAWLKTSSLGAWRRRTLRRSLFTTCLPTTSFSKAASKTAFPTTSYRTTSSLRRTLLWFSFLFTILFSNSFLFWNKSLRSFWPVNLVRLIFYMIILNKTFGQLSFSNSA